MGLLRSCLARTQTWLQAGKYLNALVSELPSRNGWSAAEHAGDRSPDRSQRLLNRASWDEWAAMSLVRKYAAAGLDDAARRSRRRRITAGVLDETGHEKQGSSTAGVKRQYMGCAGRVANGSNTVHLSYVREKTGHALAGARQWIPAEDIKDPVKSLVAGLPLDLRFRTKGGLAVDILGDAYADGLAFDFVRGDEVYGNCADLREYLEGQGQAYVLRVASNFMVTLAAGARMTCKDAMKKLLKAKRAWEVRSAGKGSKGERWYAWAWLATASPRHSLLIRRHLKTGDLAFHYCFIPDGQACSKARLIRAAGLRWPVEEASRSARTASGSTSARPGSTPRSSGMPCWSSPPWRSARSPPPSSGTGLTPKRRRPPGRTPRRRPTRASPRSPSARSGDCSPPPSPARSHPATPPAGSNGAAAIRHDPAGFTNAHAWHATMRWSASDWMLPHQWPLCEVNGPIAGLSRGTSRD
jgi:SRSO17 transposase